MTTCVDNRIAQRARGDSTPAYVVSHIGFGPWFVALAFNLAKNPKRKTHIFVHSSPEWALEVKNSVEAGESLWRNVLCVGPFELSSQAKTFKRLWEGGARPCDDRVTWGLVLCTKYAADYNIHFWFRCKDELILGANEVRKIECDREKRRYTRRGRSGKTYDRQQRIYELTPVEERRKTFGATKVRRDIREDRKKSRRTEINR